MCHISTIVYHQSRNSDVSLKKLATFKPGVHSLGIVHVGILRWIKRYVSVEECKHIQHLI